MKILLDIGHPAHVHYFKNFIWLMQEDGHTVTIVARDKEVALQLLDFYKFPYLNRGKGKKGLLGKFMYMFQADLFLIRKAMKLKPDMFISFGSIYAAQASWLMRKPHIALDDTDHNFFQHAMYIPFTKVLLTPKVFQKNFGAKHIRFDGFLELGGLHPNRFKAEYGAIQNLVNESKNKRFVILRFVSWGATHDIGLKGLSLEDKYALVQELSKYARVIISSEETLPEDLMKYSYRVHPALMHDVLNGACLLVSESLTMAAEAAFLGTPTICISTAQAGTLDEEVKLGLIELYRTSDGLISRAVDLVRDEQYKSVFSAKSKAIVKNKVDMTALLAWFVNNYPESFAVMKKDPAYEANFK
jgi:predicted glycosyltransferase